MPVASRSDARWPSTPEKTDGYSVVPPHRTTSQKRYFSMASTRLRRALLPSQGRRYLLLAGVVTLLAIPSVLSHSLIHRTTPVTPIPTKHTLNPDSIAVAQSATLTFLAASVHDAEEKLSPVSINYTTIASDHSGLHVTQSFYWALDGERMRFDINSSKTVPIASHFIWDGHLGKTWTGSIAGKNIGNQSVTITDDPHRVWDAYHYLGWAGQRLNGEPLSQAILSRGVSAKRLGKTWLVRISPESNNLGGYELVVLLPDHDSLPYTFCIGLVDGG